MPEVRIEINSALAEDTPIICDTEQKTARDIFLLQSGKPIETFALIGNKIGTSHIMNIPQELYANSLCEIILVNGFHFKCTPATKILMYNQGYKSVKDIVDGDKVTVLRYTHDGPGGVDAVDIKSHDIETSALKKPVYIFVTEHGNLFIPYTPKDKENTIEFVVVKQ